MSKPVLANLGFLLQIGGLLTLPPILVGLYYNEVESLVAIFLGSISFLGCGFLLNALCQRRDLDFRSSCAFFVTAFTALSLIGAVPYVYADPFNSSNALERLTNALFESVSGFTTTGFSFITSSENLPRSMLLYRSVTELMGGVGIVFLLLLFFHSEKSINSLGNTLGIEKLNGDMRKTFITVFLIYGVYIAIFASLFYALGVWDPVGAVSLVIDTITGGFQPSPSQFQRYLSPPFLVCFLVLMFLGSVNFSFNYHLLTRKLNRLLPREIRIYISVIVAGTVIVAVLSGMNAFDALFHVVSMSSSTGYDYIGIPNLNDTVLSVFLLLMILGGCAFSMAGGIKVFRIMSFFSLLKHDVNETIAKEGAVEEDPGTRGNIDIGCLSSVVSILLFVGTLFIFSTMFSTIGVSFTDALFEVGSALTTNGISMGATTVSMPTGYKYLLMVTMIIGRVEIMTILVAVWKHQRINLKSLWNRMRELMRLPFSGRSADLLTMD
jgi:trk system potassium uptake protein TrkH